MSRTPTIVVVPHVTTRTEYVTREVHEHRAPTDQSVALLKEMEGAARDKIVEAVKIGDTSFECVIHREMDAMSYQTVWRAVFSLNGKRETAEVRLNGFNRDHQAVDALTKLRDEIAFVIASRMISAAMSSMPKFTSGTSPYDHSLSEGDTISGRPERRQLP